MESTCNSCRIHCSYNDSSAENNEWQSLYDRCYYRSTSGHPLGNWNTNDPYFWRQCGSWYYSFCTSLLNFILRKNYKNIWKYTIFVLAPYISPIYHRQYLKEEQDLQYKRLLQKQYNSKERLGCDSINAEILFKIDY